MEATKKAYDEILKVLHKHKDLCLYDIAELERTAKIHLFGLELKEKYGLNIDPKRVDSLDYQSFGEKKIGLFGRKHKRTISWSFDGRQPEDEYLFKVSFPTGAYIFGDGESQHLISPTRPRGCYGNIAYGSCITSKSSHSE